MGVLSYTATRELEAGTNLNDPKQIETAWQRIDFDRREIGTSLRSLGGREEYELDRFDEMVSLASDMVALADLARWREFFASVGARESFTLDVDGTIAVPGTTYTVRLMRGRYQPVRVGANLYQFDFVARVI